MMHFQQYGNRFDIFNCSREIPRNICLKFNAVYPENNFKFACEHMEIDFSAIYYIICNVIIAHLYIVLIPEDVHN